MKHPDGIQLLIAVDQLFNTFFCGYADETLSARAHRHALKGDRKWPEKLIDFIFFGSLGTVSEHTNRSSIELSCHPQCGKGAVGNVS